mgnify:CR=1 FL=1
MCAGPFRPKTPPPPPPPVEEESVRQQRLRMRNRALQSNDNEFRMVLLLH